MKVFVCATVVAMVMGFVMSASAQVEDNAGLEDQIAVGDETPYVDEKGNFDVELAKEYAELVDNYVDENGVAWDVWLDEFGGQMWAEAVDAKTGDAVGDGVTPLVVHLFVPEGIQLWRASPFNDYVVYWRTGLGSGDGEITYTGSCGTRCSLWTAWVAMTTPSPMAENVEEILAYGTSSADYCDAYYNGSWYLPDGAFGLTPDNETCEALPYGFGYKYWIGDDDYPTPYSDNDYDYADRLVDWQYRISGLTYKTRVDYKYYPE
jgi:hypothetical protein